jgi:uridine kinase
MQRCPIIAIAGGSASGKSTLSQHLHTSLTPSSVILPLDRYYHDLSRLTYEERAKINFDHPNALDITLYVEHLQSLSSQKPILAPIYDFTTHNRSGEELIEPHPVILTDGILLLAIKEIRDCINFSVFLDVPEHIRLERKIKRDVKERGRTEKFARNQFYNTVKPIHDELVTSSMQFADLILDGTQPPHVLLISIMDKLIPLLN